jgi:hypothetical protein
VSLDEIIAEADLVLNREIESLERHFLHIERWGVAAPVSLSNHRLWGVGAGGVGVWISVCLAWVRQFNEEEEAGILGEGPSLDQGSAMTEHAQPEEQEESQEEELGYDERLAILRPVQDFPRREHVVNMDDDANALMNELLQDRMEGEAPYHITPQPSAKDTLKEIQSIIDEDVKDLIPEGTYLLLANKMKEAFDRS